jgi:hypothetical protein
MPRNIVRKILKMRTNFFLQMSDRGIHEKVCATKFATILMRNKIEAPLM